MCQTPSNKICLIHKYASNKVLGFFKTDNPTTTTTLAVSQLYGDVKNITGNKPQRLPYYVIRGGVYSHQTVFFYILNVY